ncbi:PREDICTED: opioid-binding protein/cell adhesion molecule homolog [Dufourea novaeangliae]|uniref:opioid-binding protein/cell adhesion molecule homolog n=1 Tax=Dufourea novaeangliae TaxID=178035 RepID=UPI0007670C8D|nr:PREDICTED: opioid-binding protein/cell adhesion molecule homolog [Dufourea novaeangliae]
MVPMRFIGLLVVLLAAQAWCKPAKSAEGEDYNDDDPPVDYNDGDTVDDDDDPGTSEEPPQIVSKAEIIRARNGSTIWLHCLVKNTDNLAVTWKRNDENLYYDSIAMTQDKNRIVRLPNNTLVIHNVTVNDTSDDYECSILQNPPITIKHKVVVDTYNPPIRVIPGKRVEVNAGETLNIGCETTIRPAPEIKWYHETVRIRNDETPSSHLTIHNVTRHDSGHYHCLAEDGSQKPPLEVIAVVVNYAPEIEAKKESVHTGLGVESELTCIVHAHPAARVRWYRDGKEVVPETGRIEVKSERPRYTLKIMHTKQKDLGKYTCVAENRMKRSEKDLSLTGAPSQAVIFGSEVTKTDRGLMLKWRLQSYSPITEYKLEYRPTGATEWITLKPPVTNGKGNQFIVKHEIEGLQPESYEAILLARNEFGWSQPSKPYTFTTEYIVEEAENVKGPSADVSGATLTMATLFLVVSSCAFTSL